MSKQTNGRKGLVVGIFAAIIVLAALVVVLLTQCTGVQTAAPTTEASVPSDVVEKAQLYWNLDRALYDGKSEAGMSSRKIGSDGYYHIRFFQDGKVVELLATDKAMVNNIEVRDLMGIVTDENGVITEVVPIEQMPVQKLGWKFYVQSVGGNVVKVNSSDKFNGLEIVLKVENGAKVYDMTGTAGEPGTEAQAAINDRVMCVADLDGNLKSIYIYDRSNMEISFQAECQHCKEEVKWVVWKNAKTLPLDMGHYQLGTDVQLTKQQSMRADAKICLDLNGHRVDGADGARVYSVHNLNCELAIMDTSEAGNGRLAAHGLSEAQGMCVWVRHGACYLYNGILDASDATTTNAGGTAVYVAAGRFFYMNGGEIIGGTAKYKYVEKSKTYTNGQGGAVYVKGGKFVLNDGVIRDGRAQSVKTVKNGKVTYQRGLGGNIFVTGGTLEINGGTITGGRAGSGGNIFLNGASEFKMTGGKITKGRSTDPGRNCGNLYINDKVVAVISGGRIDYGATEGVGGNIVVFGKLTMTAGSVTWGKLRDEKGNAKANPTSANLYVGNGGYFKMHGGYIDGSAAAIDSSTTDGKHTVVSLTRNARINSHGFDHPGLTLMTGKEKVVVLVDEMGKGASVGVNASGIFSQKTDVSNLSAFYSDVDGVDVVYTEGCLAMGKMACLCGAESGKHFGKCDGTELLWGPWTSETTLPSAAGNYFLMTDVNVKSQQSMGGEAINLNLNGHTVTGDVRTAQVNTHLSVVDHVGGGVISGRGYSAKKDHSGVFQVLKGGLDLYAGTLKLADDHNALSNAGVMAVAAGTEVNIYGGTIDARNSGTAVVDEGGAIRLSGIMNVYAGKIYGVNTTNNGGAISVWKGGELNVRGGTITGAKTGAGGTIYLKEGASVNIVGGTITGGNADNGVGTDAERGKGGNILAMPGSNLNIYGGKITDGKASNNGGNVGVLEDVKAVISGGFIGDGSVKGDKTNANANLYVRNNSITISGGEIDGYISMIVTSSKYKDSKLNLSGDPILNGGKTNVRLYATTLANQPKIDIDGTLTGKPGSIGITMQNKPGVFATDAEQDEAAVFFSDDKNYSVVVAGDTLRLETPKCLCGADSGAKDDGITHEVWCNGDLLIWQAWNGTDALTDGNWYLTGDVTVDMLGVSEDINLDLAGHKLSATGVDVHSTLRLVDSSAGNAGKVDGGVSVFIKLCVYDAVIDGTLHGSVELGGNAKLTSLRLSYDEKVTLNGLGADAEVVLTMIEPGVFAEGVETDVSANFTPSSADYEILYKETEKQLEYKKKASHSHCWCIHADVVPENHVCADGKIWTPIEKSGSAFTAEDGKSYYLNWAEGEKAAKSITIPAGCTVQLCLNGAHIRAGNVIKLGENAKLTICDCKKSAIMTTTKFSPLIVAEGQEVTLMSGTISGTYSDDTSRVSVLVQGGTFNMYGGKVERGCAKHSVITNKDKKEADGTIGGNIRIDSGVANILGGSVTGGKLLDGTDRDVTLADGTLKVGKKAEIGVLYLPEGKTISVVEKDLDTKIGISMAKPGDPIAAVKSDVSAGFTSLVAEYPVLGMVKGNLVLHAALTEGGHYHCVCENAESLTDDHKCTTVQQWEPIAKKTSASTTLEDGGHYYLNWTGGSAQSVKVADGAEAYLCLNGATIYAGSAITLGKGATLHICDCSSGETGKITRSGSTKRALIEMDAGVKTLHLYSGTINGTNSGKSIRCVEMYGGTGTFYMYGGRITGGNGDSLNTTNAASEKKSTTNGGNILMAGGTQKFYFYGGKIDGGTVDGKDLGGTNLFIGGANCKFYLNGGTMEVGTLNGTNTRGGNVYMTKGEFIMNSGTIEGGTVTGKGGAVMLMAQASNSAPKFVMNGGIIEGGSAANGGTVCLNALDYTGATAVFELNGGTVKGGTATANGGTFYLDSVRDTLTVNGGTIETGTAAAGACIYNKGGNVTVAEGATVGTITTP